MSLRVHALKSRTHLFPIVQADDVAADCESERISVAHSTTPATDTASRINSPLALAAGDKLFSAPHVVLAYEDTVDEPTLPEDIVTSTELSFNEVRGYLSAFSLYLSLISGLCRVSLL